MRSVLLLFAVVLSAALVTGSTQMFPERFRHGRLYRELMEAEEEHHRRVGYTPNKTAGWFPQHVDHGDSSLGTFMERYFIDLTHYNPNKPLCMMYLNGEAPLTASIGGYMADIAKNLSACTVSIEHRWYGESLPGPLTDKALLTKTLSVEQAQQDIIVLMDYFQKNIVGISNLTWFLVGGSYSGAMTVWMNERYPGRFAASWAASGVVRSTFAFTEYDGHIQAVVSEKCSTALKNVYKVAEEMYDDPSQRGILMTMFNIPSYFTKTDILWALADVGAGCVQYSAKNHLCNSVLPQPEEPLAIMQQYFNYVNDTWGDNFVNNCGYSTACMANASMSSQWAGAGYSWIWQICSEMAWWQIGYPNSIRYENIDTEYFMDQCRRVFYTNASADSWAFNQRHHGRHPIAPYGKIIATQGSDDPWSTTGLKYSQGPTFPVTTCQCDDCGHCGSMMSPKPTDPLALQEQRDEVIEHLREWLGRSP